MPLAVLNGTPAVSADPPVAISQPVVLSVRRSRVDTASAGPAASSERTDAPAPRGDIHSQAAASAGTTRSAAAILASKPSPTHTPDTTTQRVRPSSSARTIAHNAPTTHSTSNASGLLW